MDPLLLVVPVAAVAAAFCWVASLTTRDVSWVDRLRSKRTPSALVPLSGRQTPSLPLDSRR